jgi:hypothetical protein
VKGDFTNFEAPNFKAANKIALAGLPNDFFTSSF